MRAKKIVATSILTLCAVALLTGVVVLNVYAFTDDHPSAATGPIAVWADFSLLIIACGWAVLALWED